MINVLTAILNENINYKLKEYEKLNLKYDDIQYEEGLIEILENNSTDVLIISSMLFKNKNIERLLKLINKDGIVILIKLKEEIFEEYENLIQIDNNTEDEIINNIVYIIRKRFDISINKISSINYLKEENEKIKNELEILKNKIEQKSENKILKKIKKLIAKKEICIEENKDKTLKKGKIILITGTNQSGKTVLTSLIGSKLSEKEKTLVIDMDFINKNIITLFNKKKFNKKEDKNILIKINDNLELLSDLDIVINDYKTNVCEKLDILITQLLYKYEYILIDFEVEDKNTVNKYILNKANKIIFLIEGNLLNIKKAQKILEEITRIINKNKVQIIVNKNNKNFIEKEIIENLLNFRITYLIKYSDNFDKFINSNGSYKFENKNIKNFINIIKN